MKLWQPQIGQVITVLGGTDANLRVRGLKVTPNGQAALVAQSVSDDKPGFTLFLFDTGTRQLRELWSEADLYLFSHALADNGRSAAFVTSTTSFSVWRTNSSPAEIKVIDGETGQITPLAVCPNTREPGSYVHSSSCLSLISAPNSQTWLWADIEGVWQGGIEQPAQLLVPHDYFEDALPRTYSPTTDWSPNSRYQLLLSQSFESQHRWLLDMNNGQTLFVPNSGIDFGASPHWQWTQGNRLLALRPQTSEGNVLELWRIEGEQLVQDASLSLPEHDSTPPTTAVQLPDGRFALIINSTDPSNPATRNLYLIPSFDQPAQALVSLPPLEQWWDAYGQSLSWTPDASGVLYSYPIAETTRPIFIPADGSALYDLTNLLGTDITNPVWLP